MKITDCDYCMPKDGKHETRTYRCWRCGIVRWIDEGRSVDIRIGHLVLPGVLWECAEGCREENGDQEQDDDQERTLEGRRSHQETATGMVK